jgi:hypothetical protein
MTSTIPINIRRISRSIIHNITTVRTRKHLIEKFTKKVGLIYFGAVNQRRDEHHVVRGFTASSSHQDNHYSVGSVNGYDIILVDRSDTVIKDDSSVVVYNWLIMSFDLCTERDIPHIFIKANNHDSSAYETLFTTFPLLTTLNLGTFEDYNIEFTSRFTFYTQPSNAIEVERLFPAKIARVLGAHFWPLSVELKDGILYVYSDEKNITQNILNTMLQDGLWLAQQIDSQIEQI